MSVVVVYTTAAAPVPGHVPNVMNMPQSVALFILTVIITASITRVEGRTSAAKAPKKVQREQWKGAVEAAKRGIDPSFEKRTTHPTHTPTV